mgnify:CR=1 FL=1
MEKSLLIFAEYQQRQVHDKNYGDLTSEIMVNSTCGNFSCLCINYTMWVVQLLAKTFYVANTCFVNTNDGMLGKSWQDLVVFTGVCEVCLVFCFSKKGITEVFLTTKIQIWDVAFLNPKMGYSFGHGTQILPILRLSDIGVNFIFSIVLDSREPCQALKHQHCWYLILKQG